MVADATSVASVVLWSMTVRSKSGWSLASTLATACPILSGRLRVQMTADTWTAFWVGFDVDISFTPVWGGDSCVRGI